MEDSKFLIFTVIVLIVCECVGQAIFQVIVKPHKLDVDKQDNQLLLTFWPISIGDFRLVSLVIMFVSLPIYIYVSENTRRPLANMTFLLLLTAALAALAFFTVYRSNKARVLLVVNHYAITVYEANVGETNQKIGGPYVPVSVNYRWRDGSNAGPRFYFPLFAKTINRAEAVLIDSLDNEDIAESIKEILETHLKLPKSIPETPRHKYDTI